MTRKQKATLWFQRVILRGIEGIIGDEYLLQICNPNTTEGHLDHTESLSNYMEAKYMAEQIYAQLQGVGL